LLVDGVTLLPAPGETAPMTVWRSRKVAVQLMLAVGEKVAVALLTGDALEPSDDIVAAGVHEKDCTRYPVFAAAVNTIAVPSGTAQPLEAHADPPVVTLTELAVGVHRQRERVRGAAAT